MPPDSAIPDFYYYCFAIYEPSLTVTGFIGAWMDPKGAHDAQAPWLTSPPPPELPNATLVTMVQLAHVCALLGVVNYSVLSVARNYLQNNLFLQEKVVSALLTPLLFGDVFHLYLTLWALGDQRWNLATWTPMLWITVIVGITLLIPRITWHLGIGRYVHKWHKKNGLK
ncbi:hypothetical protein F5887DRAFT_206390 [Amanita rubescens]|nr:hypothetical protein F5887DRAFT_206390 [Amanita rubescens]